MIDAEWWEFDDAKTMAAQVADDVEAVIERAIEGHGAAVIALPGGKSPVPAFEALAKRKSIAWDKVTILPGDERLVPAEDALSNVALLKKHFGKTAATILDIVPDRSAAPAAAGRAADALLQELRWPIDLVWVGMGADGHIASLLPGPDLEGAINGPSSRRAVGVTPDPLPKEAPVARVTLTRAGLTATRALMVTITGDDKRAVAERALEDGPLSRTAFGRVLAESDLPVDIFWCPA